MTDDNNYTLTLSVFDSGEARSKLRGATQVILSLEQDYEAAVNNAAETEAFYRLRLAEQFKVHRDTGTPVEASNTLARGDVVPESKARDVAAGKLKLAGERLENARDTRRTLWRLVEWSAARDVASMRGPAQQRFPENAPASSWP